jgi:hypothetical protein
MSEAFPQTCCFVDDEFSFSAQKREDYLSIMSFVPVGGFNS